MAARPRLQKRVLQFLIYYRCLMAQANMDFWFDIQGSIGMGQSLDWAILWVPEDIHHHHHHKVVRTVSPELDLVSVI